MKYSILLLLMALFAGPTGAQELQPPGQGPQETEIPEEALLQTWTKLFQDAEAVFNSENQPQSIPLFQDLLNRINEEKNKRKLMDPEQSLFLRSLDYLGQGFYLEGQQDESRDTFLRMIEIDPNYRMNEEFVSSKIIDFVARIKADNLATVSVTSVPPGAAVKIDGVEVGITDLTSVYSMKGTHEVEVNRSGYHPQKQTVTLNPGKIEKVAFVLERSSSVAYFVTYPKGVEILMAGKSLGFTGGEPSQRSQTAATEQNLPAAEFSGEFPIPDLQPGVYEIEFRKPCWETPNRKITIAVNDDYYFTPIVLEASEAYISITADDPQANIFIDNEYKGLAPKQSLQLCPGKHLVKLKGPFGKFEKQVDLKKGQTLSVNAKLNPSLSFLGVVSFSALAKTQLERYRQETIKQLEGLLTLNIQDNSKAPDQAAIDEIVQELAISLEDGLPNESRLERIQQLSSKVESDLLLFGLIPEKAEERTVDYYLLSTWSTQADVRRIQSGNADQWKLFRSQLDYEHRLFEKRLGVNAIDTAITRGPVIAKLSLKTYQETQPLMVGDVITAIEDRPVKTTDELLAAALELQSAESVRLSVSRSGAPITIPVQMMKSAMELDPTSPSLLFNRELASFKKSAGLDKTSAQERSIAQLNIALCHIRLKEYEKALEQLQQIQLQRAVGIGQGTILYRMAMAQRALGRIQEARKSLAEALQSTQNTLGSDDGVSLAIEAERLQRTLSGS